MKRFVKCFFELLTQNRAAGQVWIIPPPCLFSLHILLFVGLLLPFFARALLCRMWALGFVRFSDIRRFGFGFPVQKQRKNKTDNFGCDWFSAHALGVMWQTKGVYLPTA
jgi:hypothetical protein